MDNAAFSCCSDLNVALRERSVSAVELFEAAVARIERLDPELNAVVVRDFERARAASREADRALAADDRRPLLGIPITVKESFNVKGLLTNWGMPDYRDWRPRYDAEAVTRLRAAGAVVLGKTNVPYALADWQTSNQIYGRTANPWNLECTPGGSSGGGAAALAAGLVPLELGSDFAGSLRAPAHFCGIVSHRPSVGLISMRGHAPPTVEGGLPFDPFDLAAIGPMARFAVDLELAFELLLNENAAERLEALQLQNLGNARVLVISQHPLQPTARAISVALDQLVERLEAVGARVSYAGPKSLDLSLCTAVFLQLVRSTHQHPLLNSVLARAPDRGRVFHQLAAAIDRLSASSTAELCGLQALNQARLDLSAQWRTIFQQWDVVLCPAMSTPAFRHNEELAEQRTIMIDQKPYPYFDQVAWPSTAPGLPATVAPIGFDDDGQPIGVQIIGPMFGDRTTIRMACLMEREFGGFIPPPRYR